MRIYFWCTSKVQLLIRMLAVLFFILMPIVFVGTASAKPSVDDDLIFAVKFDDAPSVLHLIEQGADAYITETISVDSL